ncbi:MAG TPA: hypothetical protein V6D20_10545 [Candidatus Obscuribacterales bacterium]
MDGSCYRGDGACPLMREDGLGVEGRFSNLRSPMGILAALILLGIFIVCYSNYGCADLVLSV